MTKTKVLVVDDSAMVRGILSKVIKAQDDMTLVATAANGKLGVEKAAECQPDVVILDIEMPVMTGLEAVVEIRRDQPKLPVIMFSTLTASGADVTMRCMRAGATDFALKPGSSSEIVGSVDTVLADLLTKIRSLVQPASPVPLVSTPLRRPSSSAPSRLAPQAVAIGSSTGGPAALEALLKGFSRPLSVPLFIVQHMPPVFTRSLAERLDGKISSDVFEAADGAIAGPGQVYIAPGGAHMKLVRSGAMTEIRVFDGDPVNSCRPSVEPLFESVAEIYGPRVVSVILTGMGSDGVGGAGTLAKLGAHVLAQDEATCVVYGMPRAVVESGHATEVLPLHDMARRIESLVSARAMGRAA